MARLLKDADKKVGASPGTLFVESISPHTKGFMLKYNRYEIHKSEVTMKQLTPDMIHDNRYSHWYHFEGFGQKDFFEAVKASFHIPALQLADLVNTDQHPKFEDLKDHLFFLLKTVTLNKVARMVEYNHLGIFVGEDYVLTFCERPTNVFDNVVKRLESGIGKIRERNEDYLFYALLDAVVDQYLAVTEKLGDEVENLEGMIAHERYGKNLTKNIYRLRTEFLFLRKLFVPIREGIRVMINHVDELFEEDLTEYLKDLQDHIKQVENATSSYRALTSDLLDIYATNINLRTNRIITFLTIYSTIFIPLTFITGLYGMNFKYMPELDYKYAYPIVWVVMGMITIGMIAFFKKKRWV